MSANSERKLTIVESILLAADELDRQQGVFSAEDLVVRAWKMFPDKFGLQGYAADYPDSNRILTKIMGASSGLKTRGCLERIGTKKYKLSEVGRSEAGKLTHHESEARLAAIPRQFLGTLKRMLTSTAYDKYRRGESLTFSDAAAFWNISARSSANQLNLRLSESRAAIASALNTIDSAGGALPGESQTLSREDLENLSRLSDSIETLFSRELAVIKRRVNERYV